MNVSDNPTAADWLARDAQRLPWAELHRLQAEQRGTYAAQFQPSAPGRSGGQAAVCRRPCCVRGPALLARLPRNGTA